MYDQAERATIYSGPIHNEANLKNSAALGDLPKEPSELEIILNRLYEANDRASRANTYIGEFLGRSLGPTPETCNGAYPPASSPDSHLSRIHTEIDILLSRLQDINEQTDRLSRIG